MKIKEFDDFLKNNYSEINEEWQDLMQNLIKEKKKSNKIAIIICAICDVIMALIYMNIRNKILNVYLAYISYKFIIIIFGFVVLNVIIFLISKAVFGKEIIIYQKINKMYKEKIIKELLNNFYDNLEYFPNKEMPEGIYESVEYPEYYNKYWSDDYFEGKINNKYLINMAEVHTEKEEKYEDSEGNKRTRTYTVFHGLFFKIINEKSINSTLKIGSYFYDKNKLKMDSSEFEKKFDVSATNKILAMQLLTADIMEDLLKFKRKIKDEFDVVIKDNDIYIRFHCGAMFERGSIKKGPIDKQNLQKYFEILKFTYELSNKFISIIEETEI